MAQIKAKSQGFTVVFLFFKKSFFWESYESWSEVLQTGLCQGLPWTIPCALGCGVLTGYASIPPFHTISTSSSVFATSWWYGIVKVNYMVTRHGKHWTIKAHPYQPTHTIVWYSSPLACNATRYGAQFAHVCVKHTQLVTWKIPMIIMQHMVEEPTTIYPKKHSQKKNNNTLRQVGDMGDTSAIPMNVYIMSAWFASTMWLSSKQIRCGTMGWSTFHATTCP